ncbi:MAG: hypothetical protein KDD63_03115 [Bacteroidetes bacterium]|nr:hypothetical protein [Bacteroidota bacterium]
MLGRSELIFILIVIFVVFWPFFARRAGVKRREVRRSRRLFGFVRNKRNREPKATTVEYEELD